MQQPIFSDKATRLFVVLASFFVANAIIAECIGGKLFSLEKLIGRTPNPFTLLGEPGLTFTLTAGVILWPLEFIMTDIVNEYFGPKAVRRISYIAVGLITYAFVMFYVSIELPADTSFWTGSQRHEGIGDMQVAYASVFGQGMWIIAGSLVAFLVAQVLDVWIFQKIKQITGDKKVWLRATGSTLVSQLVDSFIVLFIAFYIGRDWSINRVLSIALVNYTYKGAMAVILTPIIYLAEYGIEKYLGKEKSVALKQAAMEK